MSEALDTYAAAACTGLSASTLRKLRLTGRGPKFLKMGKAVRYRTADLEVWLAARTMSSTSEQIAA